MRYFWIFECQFAMTSQWQLSVAKLRSLMTFDLEQSKALDRARFHGEVPLSDFSQPQKPQSGPVCACWKRKPRLSGTLWLHCQSHPQLGQNVRRICFWKSQQFHLKRSQSKKSANVHHGPTCSQRFSHMFPYFFHCFSSQGLRAPCWSKGHFCPFSAGWNRLHGGAAEWAETGRFFGRGQHSDWSDGLMKSWWGYNNARGTWWFNGI